MNEVIRHLQYVKDSLQAAREVKYESVSATVDSHIQGLQDGLDIAIRAIDLEIRMVEKDIQS